MERLRTDLASLLEDNFAKEITIPLSIKLSILLDVSYGLLYLHTHTPTIIHRDLTAPNILVTNDMRAKIADLGVSKLLDPHTRAAKSLTRGPGTFVYMPPEALREKHLTATNWISFHLGILYYTQSTRSFHKFMKLPSITQVSCRSRRGVKTLPRWEMSTASIHWQPSVCGTYLSNDRVRMS